MKFTTETIHTLTLTSEEVGYLREIFYGYTVGQQQTDADYSFVSKVLNETAGVTY